jgi:metallothiol transferase
MAWKSFSPVALSLALSVIQAGVAAAESPRSAQNQGGPTMTSTSLRVSHIILRVSNMERSLAFYRDAVGMKVQSASNEFAALDGGGVTLLLNKPERPPAGESAGLASLTEIVLEVPDVHSTYQSLKARCVPFRVEPRTVTSDGSRDLLAADFRDPDGHVLSLTGWVPQAKP